MAIFMNADIVKKYLELLRDFCGLVTTDHLSGWENPTRFVPDHLHGARFVHYLQGQAARKLRDKSWYTYIISQNHRGEQFVSKCFSGRLSHKRIVKICKKAGALDSITAYTVDAATGAQTERSIGG